MEQKHSTSSSKYSDSTLKTQERSTMSTTNNKQLSIDSMEEEQRNTNVAPNQKSKGFRGIFKLFPFSSGGKSKSQSSKNRNEQTSDESTFDVDEIRQLIVLFSKYDNLYNTRNPQYGNKQIENIYYSDMARSFPNKTGPQIQAMLMDLRATFEEEYAIIEDARSRYGEIRTPSTKYYKEFLFLVPFLNLPKISATTCESTTDISNVTPTNSIVENRLSVKDVAANITCKHNNQCMLGMPATPFIGVNHLGQNLYNQRLAPKRKYRKSTDQDNEQTMSNQEQLPKKQQSTLGRCDNQIANDQPCPENCNATRTQMQSEQTPAVSSNPRASSQSTALGICCAAPPSEQCPNVKLAPGQAQNNEDPVVCFKKETCAAQYTQSPTRKSQESERLEYSDRCHFAPRNGQGQSACPATTQESAKDNGQQLQMLCDMIRAELSSAPDFIYFDAKWRIIEILREVNKRQMIYKKGDPEQNGARNSDDINDHSNNAPTRCTNARKSCNNCTFCTARAGR